MVPDFADCWYRSGLLLNFAFHGQTGRGKTHLAIAVGSAAVSAGRTVRFFGTAGLVLSLLKASREEALDKYLADIEKSDLVILDEFGYIPIDPEGARLLFQVISSCCERRSLILTTNIEFGKWGTVLGDEKLAAAAIDRIVHHGWLVEFGGESAPRPARHDGASVVFRHAPVLLVDHELVDGVLHHSLLEVVVSASLLMKQTMCSI